MKCVILLFITLAIASAVLGDVYMHNPRGSNDRNCERNENRNNGNRLFDSQNNAKGGYACPRAVGGPNVVTDRMYYYVGSYLPVEWTSQHSCGSTNNYCHIVLQYACEDSLPGLRDGTPNDNDDAATKTIDPNDENDQNVGKHENAEYYKKCQTRTRQGGLYLADRQTENPGNLRANSPATNTRQNPGGARSGLECPEERDYYPYWHPTPWRDIAIFTNDLSQCQMYQSQSQNVMNKGECYTNDAASTYLAYNNYFDCTKNNGKWVESGRWGTSAPECLSTDLLRTADNHLGYKYDGKPATYMWRIPDLESKACVLRLRYNISTDDVPFNLDFKSNGLEKSPIKQDPFDTFGGHATYLSIAANTNQFGRTFQDRSYVFEIRKRPPGVGGRIYNLNVKGKRGNIVQTYPAIEYRFAPEYLEVSSGDYIHFQWTGSDYNPNRNPNDAEGGPLDPADGQSTRADRSNIVQLDYGGMSVPRPAQFNTMFINPRNGKPDMDTINKFAFIGQDLNVCKSWEELLALNNNNKNQAEKDPRNCAKLNAAKTPYFDGGLVRMHASGTFHYFSTRNNNFSNRSQKGIIKVTGGVVAGAATLSSSLALIVALISAIMML